MAFKLAEAFVELTQRGFGGVTEKIQQITGKVEGMGSVLGRVTSMVPGLGVALGAIGGGASIAGMVAMAAQAESTATSFEVMLGSASDAQRMIAEFTEFSAGTPFSFPGLTEAGKTLLNFGVQAKDVLPAIDAISNVASGNEQRMQQLALVYGQVSGAGRLMGQDVLQMINAGFNPLMQISQRTGESMVELKKRMEQGAISFDEVSQAFVDATSEGGKFYQMNDKQATTLAGLWSTLKDNVGLALKDLGESIAEAFDLKSAQSSLIEFVQSIRGNVVPAIEEWVMWVGHVVQKILEWKEVLIFAGTAIGVVVAGLAVMKAALIATAAAQSMLLALSGPAGWAILAAGLTAGAAATVGITKSMHNYRKELEATQGQAKTTKDAIADIGSAMEANAKAAEANVEMAIRQRMRLQTALDKWWDEIRKANEEQAVVSGEKTREDIKLEGFAREGVTEDRLNILRELWDQVAVAKAKAERIDELKQLGQTITSDVMSPVEKFRDRIDEAMEAMSRGTLSVDAFDTFKDNMKRNLLESVGVLDSTKGRISDTISSLKEAFDEGIIDQSQLQEGISNLQSQYTQSPQQPPRSQTMSLASLSGQIQSASLNKQEKLQEKANEYLNHIAEALTKNGIRVQPQPAVAG